MHDMSRAIATTLPTPHRSFSPRANVQNRTQTSPLKIAKRLILQPIFKI